MVPFGTFSADVCPVFPSITASRFLKAALRKVSGAASFRSLKPDGLLAIPGSHFHFSDATTANFFKAVYRTDRPLARADKPSYSRDNFEPGHALYSDAVFRKKERL